MRMRDFLGALVKISAPDLSADRAESGDVLLKKREWNEEPQSPGNCVLTFRFDPRWQ